MWNALRAGWSSASIAMLCRDRSRRGVIACSISGSSKCSAALMPSSRSCDDSRVEHKAMANFEEALVFVLRNEDPHLSGVVTEDSGGRTRFGIAERFHPELGDEFYSGVLESALVTAGEIYRAEYWQSIHGEEIKAQAIATKLLNMAVNMVYAMQSSSAS